MIVELNVRIVLRCMLMIVLVIEKFDRVALEAARYAKLLKCRANRLCLSIDFQSIVYSQRVVHYSRLRERERIEG
jgi:hypothetical protein